jgi:hypothetical protein
LNPVLLGWKAFPTVKATIVVKFLVKKYLPPFSNFQFSVSLSSVKPDFVKRSLHKLVTWNGLIALDTNSKNSLTNVRAY